MECPPASRQILDILAEIGACCRLNAISPLSKINLVHIEFKNFIFRVLTLELKREKDFLNLAFQRSILCQIGILRKLLCNGRAALRNRASAYIRPNGTHNPARVNADVLVEAVVLNGDKCILKVFRYLIDADRSAVLSSVDVRDLVAIDIVDL